MNFYQHHIGDFNNATRHLSRIERSIYRDLLELYYDTEKPLTSDFDKLARRCIVDDCDRAAMREVLNEFFTLEDDGYHNNRADAEIGAYKRMSEGGKRGAEKRWGKGNDSHPIATQFPPNAKANANHKPLTTNQEPRVNPNHNPPFGLAASECDEPPSEPKNEIATPKPPSPSAEPPGFVVFWAEYPKKSGRKAALSAWRTKRLEPRADGLIADVRLRSGTDRKWLDGYAPNPATYLNQERWNDEIERGANGARASPNKPSAGDVTMRNFESAMRKMDAGSAM